MIAVFGKEFKNSMRTMTGPIFIAFVLLWYGIFTGSTNLDGGMSQFEYTVSRAAFLSLLALPLLTMRSFSEERRLGTDKLLYSLPLKTPSVVVAKFLASLAVFAIPTSLLFLYPLILSKFGTVYLNTAYSAIFVYFLIGAALIAIGIFISALTESQVISAIFSLGTIILLFFIDQISAGLPVSPFFSLIFVLILAAGVAAVAWVLTKNIYVSLGVFAAGAAAALTAYIIDKTKFEGLADRWLSSLDLFGKANPFFAGSIDLSVVVYYISVTALFLFFAGVAFGKRRWN